MAGKKALNKYWIFASLIILVSCVTVYDTINNRNFSLKYNPGSVQMHPQFIVYQKSPTDLRLYYQFYPKEFSYQLSKGDSVPKAVVSLFFRVTESYKSIDIIDSLTTRFVLRGKPKDYFSGDIPINLPDNKSYIMEVFLSDMNSEVTISKVMPVANMPEKTPNSFMFLSKNGAPNFHNYLNVKDTFRLVNRLLSNDSVVLRRMHKDTVIAAAPDNSRKQYNFDYIKEDSTFKPVDIRTTAFTFQDEGIYIFSDTESKYSSVQGMYNEWFPYVKTPAELLRPLQYLNTKREMQKLWALNDPKQAVDSFWLDAAKDIERARELIRIYYNRVQLSNYYFTTIREGWRTDRGMIFIIFGIPAVVTINDDGETWTYGKGGEDDLEFFFYRDHHPLYGEFYQLDRSDEYTRIWFNATRTWRSGRVFSIYK